jgi:hypothetical protein
MDRKKQRSDQPINYQIRIQGFLKEKWAEWLNGIVVKIEHLNDGSNDTNIIVSIPDQAALRGILNKLWDLNLTLISLILLEDN